MADQPAPRKTKTSSQEYAARCAASADKGRADRERAARQQRSSASLQKFHPVGRVSANQQESSASQQKVQPVSSSHYPVSRGRQPVSRSFSQSAGIFIQSAEVSRGRQLRSIQETKQVYLMSAWEKDCYWWMLCYGHINSAGRKKYIQEIWERASSNEFCRHSYGLGHV